MSGTFLLKTGTDRISREASRSIRSNRGIPVNNPAAGRHGTSEFPQPLLPTSLFASTCGADRRVARIGVWISRMVIHLELGIGLGSAPLRIKCVEPARPALEKLLSFDLVFALKHLSKRLWKLFFSILNAGSSQFTCGLLQRSSLGD